MVANALRGNKKFLLIAGVLPLLLLLPVTGTALSPKQSSTRIVLDTPLEEVNSGDAVIFTGKLLNALDGTGIASIPININHKGMGKDYALATGTTDPNGYFSIQWIATPVDPLSSTVHIFASFDGNVEYKPSRTFEYNVNIVTKYSIDIRADKDFYYVSDKATFTVKIAGPTNNPFDPAEMHAFLDGMIVSMNRIGTGHYKYVSGELVSGIHNFSVKVKIPSPVSKFRSDFNSITSSGQIHVIKRPTTISASVNSEMYFINDEIKFDATLFDVVRGGYITDVNLTAYLTLPDQTERTITLSPIGNSYHTSYVVQETDSIGLWSGIVKFDGNYALQPSQASLKLIKVNDYRVKLGVTQQGNVTIINFTSHEDNGNEVYEVVLKLGDDVILSTRAPDEWSTAIDSTTDTIYFTTDTKPLKPGKALEFQVETAELLQSFTWEVRDIDSNVILAEKHPL